jgi:hypothetical protein
MFRSIRKRMLLACRAALMGLFVAGCSVETADANDPTLAAAGAAETTGPNAPSTSFLRPAPDLANAVRDRGVERLERKLAANVPAANAPRQCEAHPDGAVTCCTFGEDVVWDCETKQRDELPAQPTNEPLDGSSRAYGGPKGPGPVGPGG